MKCKKCGMELVEGQPFCPGCGTNNAGDMKNQPAGPEIEENKKLSASKLVAIIAIFLAIIAVLACAIVLGRKDPEPSGDSTSTTEASVELTIPADGDPDEVTCKGTYTVTDAEAAAQNAAVVATWGDRKLTNGQLQIHYWITVYNFLQSYGSYAPYYGLDYTKPLDVQAASNGMTWQQSFLEQALETWHQYVSLAATAEANGFKLDEKQQKALDDALASMDNTAETAGFESALAMLQDEMGAGCTMEDYRAYLTDYYIGYYYYLQESKDITATQDEVNAFFQKHKDEYAEQGITEDYLLYNVRHILLQPEGATTDATTGAIVATDDQWAACLSNAQTILDKWKAEDGTEEGFAALAKAHSKDGNAEQGGIYEDLTVDTNFVEEFKAWYTDKSRKPGDTGIVKTVYGYHIMFFSGSELAWPVYTEADVIQEKKNQIIIDAMAAHEVEVDYSAIVLGYVNLAPENQ